MPSIALEDLLFFAGFFLIFFFLSEEFKRSLHRLRALLSGAPGSNISLIPWPPCWGSAPPP